MSSHHTEFKTRLVATLSGDAAVTALLASGDAIYYRWPAKSVAYPAIVYEYDTNYAPEPNREGVRRLSLKLRLVGADPDVLDQLEGALQDLLDESPSALTTANWACKKLRVLASGVDDVDYYDPARSEPLFIDTTEWDVWIYSKV